MKTYAGIACLSLIITACGGSGGNNNNNTLPAVPGVQFPSSYTFTNENGDSSISYSGQTKRQAVMKEVVKYLESVTDVSPVKEDLNSLLVWDSNGNFTENTPMIFAASLNPAAAQTTFGEITEGKSLMGKIAGGYLEEGLTERSGESSRLINNDFFGWSQKGMDGEDLDYPIDVLNDFFKRVDATATDGNEIPVIGVNTNSASRTISDYGQDYRQLIDKFLTGALAFSQGTNDYLQSPFQDQIVVEDDNNYTEAEHNWDEAFGYFGAARDYADYTDDEIAGKATEDGARQSYHDTNGDGEIDLKSEFNFGASTNCAKRDRGTAANPNPTDFTKDAFEAFLRGRQILSEAAAAGELTDENLAKLLEQAEIAAVTWEKCLAATVVHYINDTTDDINNFDTDNAAFADVANFESLAKHWAEMKGFALGLQFSPYSPFRANDASLNQLKMALSYMGDAPVFPDGTLLGEAFDGGVEKYLENLQAARDIFQDIYEFDELNTANW